MRLGHDSMPVAGGASLFGVDEGHQGLSADVETDLVYNRAAGESYGRHRYLHVTLGRFTSPDPDPQGRYVDGMNGHEYVRGGPVGAVDPLGLSTCCCPEDEKELQEGLRRTLAALNAEIDAISHNISLALSEGAALEAALYQLNEKGNLIGVWNDYNAEVEVVTGVGGLASDRAGRYASRKHDEVMNRINKKFYYKGFSDSAWKAASLRASRASTVTTVGGLALSAT